MIFSVLLTWEMLIRSHSNEQDGENVLIEANLKLIQLCEGGGGQCEMCMK